MRMLAAVVRLPHGCVGVEGTFGVRPVVSHWAFASTNHGPGPSGRCPQPKDPLLPGESRGEVMRSSVPHPVGTAERGATRGENEVDATRLHLITSPHSSPGRRGRSENLRARRRKLGMGQGTACGRFSRRLRAGDTPRGYADANDGIEIADGR